MAKGIIYVMTTVVPGLIKIGKAGVDNFESRMYTLERNGYSNVVGLKRRFAIEVDEYDDKERLLDEIFSKSRVPNTELFALDVDLVIQLLSSFDGRQIYPEMTSKKESFKEATRERQGRDDWDKIPDGVYYLSETRKGYWKVNGTMRVEDGAFIVQKGSTCAPVTAQWAPEARRSAPIQNDILQADVSCNSPSTAGWVVMGKANNGWLIWKDEENQPLDHFRKKKEEK